ncbi:RNA ligase [Halobaculum roseum]|uniref:RNA ligase n=1 Tax=Halobaculum roseum TaxID=2175149 RepID=A0ABD5MPE6_9EURY|nr:RNA ligase [Halobaculum roseum]QZY02071.1 RNA ligase [Halobaculum roseum]
MGNAAETLYDRLDPDVTDPADLGEHLERHERLGRECAALPDARHGLERGTVVVDGDAVVRGYPSVPRALVLDPTVSEHFDAERVVVEEKLNGFNVRIVDLGDGQPLAFTRSGYLCPYTTDRARTLLDLGAFFRDHPRAMVCAELIGPETPYTTHDYDGVDSHALRVFDVRDRVTGEPLPVDRRRERCASYGLPQPRVFGAWGPESAPRHVRRVIEDLDEHGREGVVMKSPDATTALKYTTETHHHAEVAYAAGTPFERGRDFLFSRVMREAFQAYEFDENGDRLRERAHDLGESLLVPFVETIREVAADGGVGDEHVARGDPEHVGALLDHLRAFGVELEVIADETDGDDRVVRFRKVAEATRDRTRHYLSGGTYDE